MGMINDLLFTNPVGRLQIKALDLHAQESMLVSSNLANAETPGYKARHLAPFEADLKAAMGRQTPLARTDPGHISGRTDDIMKFEPVVEVSRAEGRLDGNNVDLDTEMTKMTQSSIMYQAVIAVRGKRGSMISSVIEAP